MLRFAVVGCGVIGTVHAAVLDGGLPGRAELAAVVDVDPAARDELAAEHGVPGLDSIDAVLARRDVDAVSVCVPSGLHAQLALRALAAGRHVVIEKPVDVSVEKALPLIAARDRAGRQVTVISQRRFSPAAQAVHAAVTAGRFGRLTSGVATLPWWRSDAYYASGGWRGTWELDGGGALMNQAIHLIDLLIWFLGEPVEVRAFTGTLVHEQIEVEDTAAAVVRFASGALGLIHGTTAAYPGANLRVAVYGERGSAEIERSDLSFFHAADLEPADGPAPANQAAAVLSAAGARPPAGGPAAAGAGTNADPAALGPGESHHPQYVDFLDAIDVGRPPLVTIEEAIKPVAVIRAVYEAARTGRPVRL